MISLLLGLLHLGQTIARSAHDPEFRALMLLYGLMLVVGSGFYAYTEGWSILDALYFCVVTLATIGYGDLAPRTAMGRAFTIVYVLIGTGVFVAVAAKLAAGVLAQRDGAKRELEPNESQEARRPARSAVRNESDSSPTDSP